MIEQQVYDMLKRYGICNSEEEFSVRFLGRSKKYFGVCKARQETLSLGAQTILLERIRHVEETSARQSKVTREQALIRLRSLSADLANNRRHLSQEISLRCLDGFKSNPL